MVVFGERLYDGVVYVGVTMTGSLRRLDMALDRRAGSAASKKTYRARVKQFAKWCEMEVEELLEGVRAGTLEFRRLFDEYVDFRLHPPHPKNPVARKTLQTDYNAVARWLKANGVKVKVKWKEFGVEVWTVVEDRRPSKEELRIMLEWASPRMQMTICVLTSSGLRPGAFVDLRVMDVDLDYHGVGRIDVPASLNRKGRKRYYTFITPEAVKKIQFWIDYRERKGEDVRGDSPLICAIGKGKILGEPITYEAVRQTYNRMLAKAGMTERSHGWRLLHLHTFRKFFRTECEIGRMPRPMIEMLMGHKGRFLDDAYWRPRDDEVLEAYKQAIPNLTITESEELRDTLERRDTEYSLKLMETEKKWMETRKDMDEMKELLEELKQRIKEKE